MILFVFEGKKREPSVFKTLEYLFLPKGHSIKCSFGNNIYELYRQLKEYDGAGDIVSLLREQNRSNPDSPFPQGIKSSDIAETYLFFDYDFQNKNLSLEQMNQQVSEMLDVFNDETDNGKLFINYPMLEALRYTNQLPDEHYNEYAVSRTACQHTGFKKLTQAFSYYRSLDFAVLDFRKTPSSKKVAAVKNNWRFLEEQNVKKANEICTGDLAIPTNKESISQKIIFDAQRNLFIIPEESVAVLSAFPLFIFDYLKR